MIRRIVNNEIEGLTYSFPLREPDLWASSLMAICVTPHRSTENVHQVYSERLRSLTQLHEMGFLPPLPCFYRYTDLRIHIIRSGFNFLLSYVCIKYMR